MKNAGKITVFIILLIILIGCGERETVVLNIPDDFAAEVKSNFEDPAPVVDINAMDEVFSETENTSASEENSSDDTYIDLTTLSATMVYSEVFMMMREPEDFIGKTVKMKGLFNYYHDEDSDISYYSCIIQDALACCSQGIEFELSKDQSPVELTVGDTICVEGVFDTYVEGKNIYATLRDAKII